MRLVFHTWLDNWRGFGYLPVGIEYKVWRSFPITGGLMTVLRAMAIIASVSVAL